MDRRRFIRNGSLAGLSMGALSAAAAGFRDKAEPAPDPGEFVLLEVTIDQLQEKMQRGEYTARSIAEQYLKRIDEIDRNGPMLRAVIELNPDALSIADELDKERKAGKVRGPLHGIPVLVKDNIDTGDRMMTTAGSLAMEGNRAAKDAFIIQQLRAAGAVLLGKTNLSEWANFRSTRSTSGWSSRGGQTRSPYILDRNPSGSSAGSGTAVAANCCAVAIGTETDGSIVSPSSVNGIVGIKPTVGLLSRSGIIPISATQDTAGPMARTVRDAAILLGALAGVDNNDPVTKGAPTRRIMDYTSFLHPGALKGRRLGIDKAGLKGHEGMVALYQQAIDLLRQQGAEVIEIELGKETRPLGAAELLVLQYEFRDGLNKYLANAKAGPRSLADVIAFNKANEGRVMPYFKQEILETSEKKTDLLGKEYLDALKKSTSARGIIDRIMTMHRLHAICAPTNGPACCIDLVDGDYDTGFYYSAPAAMAGYPHITVPMGQLQGLPIGFSFLARAYEEGTILGLAYAFEQAGKKRAAPGFVRSSVP